MISKGFTAEQLVLSQRAGAGSKAKSEGKEVGSTRSIDRRHCVCNGEKGSIGTQCEAGRSWVKKPHLFRPPIFFLMLASREVIMIECQKCYTRAVFGERLDIVIGGGHKHAIPTPDVPSQKSRFICERLP